MVTYLDSQLYSCEAIAFLELDSQLYSCEAIAFLGILLLLLLLLSFFLSFFLIICKYQPSRFSQQPLGGSS